MNVFTNLLLYYIFVRILKQFETLQRPHEEQQVPPTCVCGI